MVMMNLLSRLSGNTGIMGTGMPGYSTDVIGQVARRRNKRPDTPEELAADAAARAGGMAGAPGSITDVIGQLTRRFNNRPDTPEEMAADAAARAGATMPGGTTPGRTTPGGTQPETQWWEGEDPNLWNLPAPYPGKNLGSNDFSRFGSNLANDIFGSLGPFAGLAPQIAGAYQQLLSGTTPSAVSGPISGMQQYLSGLIDPVQQRLTGMIDPMQQYLSSQVDPMASRLQDLMAPLLTRGVSSINAARAARDRELRDTLPRALANEAIMGGADDSAQAIAGLYGQAHDAIFNPLAAAMGSNLGQVGSAMANNIGQIGSMSGNQTGLVGNAYAGGLGGMLSSALGAGGPETLLQRGLAPWSIGQGLYTLYNQGRGLELTKEAAKGK